MKPVQIALLIVAGAIGGAVMMKVVQRPQPAAPAPVAAETTAAAPASQTAQAEPVPQEAQPEAQAAEAPAPAAEPLENKPSPVREKHARPRPVYHRETHAPQPVQVAQAAPPPPAPEAAPVAVAQPQPSPEPVAPAPQPENVTPPPPPPQPRQVTLNAGLLLSVRLLDGLSSERNNPGDTFAGTLDQPLKAEGLVIAERGARVEGRVASADRGGKVRGVASLSIELTRVRLSDGQTISIRTDSFDKHAEANHGEDAAKVGGGAVIGAVIGAIAGGGKGAAIGAGVGGAAGGGDVLLTRGKPATLPSETRITFRLNTPLTVTERQQ